MRLERPDRGLDRVAGGSLLAAASPDGAESQQRACPAERIADGLVPGNRLPEQVERLVDVSACGGDEAPAARHVREHPLAPDPHRIRLQRVDEVGPPSSTSSELEQQLYAVGGPPAEAGLAPIELRGKPVRPSEPLGGHAAIAAPESNEPDNRGVLRRVEAELLLRQLEAALRMRSGELELAAVDRDDGDREVVLRHLEAVLDRDVVRTGRVRGCELEATGPKLDPGEAPECPGTSRLIALAPLVILALEQHAGVGRRASVFTIACVASWTSRSPPIALARSGATIAEARLRLRLAVEPAEDGLHGAGTGLEHVVAELFGELQRPRGVVDTRPEACRPGEPAVDRRLEAPDVSGRLASASSRSATESSAAASSARSDERLRTPPADLRRGQARRSRAPGRASTRRRPGAHAPLRALASDARPVRRSGSIEAHARRARPRPPAHRARRARLATRASSGRDVGVRRLSRERDVAGAKELDRRRSAAIRPWTLRRASPSPR